MEVARKLTGLQGRSFKGTPHTLSAKLQESKLTIPEIFSFLFDRIQIKEMGVEYYSNKDTYRHTCRNFRKAERTSSPNDQTPRAQSTSPLRVEPVPHVTQAPPQNGSGKGRGGGTSKEPKLPTE